MEQYHVAVLKKEILDLVNPQKDESYLDLTAGYGGHASMVMQITTNYQSSFLIDRDPTAFEYLKQKYKDRAVHLMNLDFLSASQQLQNQQKKFDIILADLGMSSQHINDPKRGFSFLSNSSLDMRMDSNQELDAFKVVNNYSQQSLQKILKDYGEEPKAVLIASLIIKNRPIYSTHDLALICQKAWPGYHKIHPATRTFQAIRIEVNDELNQLQLSLPIWFELLNSAGRLAIITFHSLEDRIVKRFFKEIAGPYLDSQATLINKKPVIVNQQELVNNPRSRSAKLRVVLKK